MERGPTLCLRQRIRYVRSAQKTAPPTSRRQNARSVQVEWASQQEGRKRVRRSAATLEEPKNGRAHGSRLTGEAVFEEEGPVVERRAPVPAPTGLEDTNYVPDWSEPGYADPLFPRQWHFVCLSVSCRSRVFLLGFG